MSLDTYDCSPENLSANAPPPLPVFSSRRSNLTKANPYPTTYKTFQADPHSGESGALCCFKPITHTYKFPCNSSYIPNFHIYKSIGYVSKSYENFYMERRYYGAAREPIKTDWRKRNQRQKVYVSKSMTTNQVMKNTD